MGKTQIKKEEPYCAYDEDEIQEEQVKYLLERAKDDGEELTEEEAKENAYNDIDLLNFAFDDVCEMLTDLMNEFDKGDHAWYATMSGFGWRGTSGSKTFQACRGKDLLREILPQTDCTFWIYKRDGYIAINNCHHDQPIPSKEYYYIYSRRTCACCGIIMDESIERKTIEGDYVCDECAVNNYEEDEIIKNT